MSNRYAAACAGLGELVWNGFVATEKDGPRIMWVSVVTELELEEDPLYNGPQLCDHDKCGLCSKICPAHDRTDVRSYLERRILRGQSCTDLGYNDRVCSYTGSGTYRRREKQIEICVDWRCVCRGHAVMMNKAADMTKEEMADKFIIGKFKDQQAPEYTDVFRALSDRLTEKEAQ